MNTSFFDVLHDRADHCSLAIRNTVHIHFDCVLQETINEHRPVRCHFNCTRHVTAEIFFIVDKLHRATSEHEGWPNEHRVSGLVCNRGASSVVTAEPLGVWRNPSLSSMAANNC